MSGNLKVWTRCFQETLSLEPDRLIMTHRWPFEDGNLLRQLPNSHLSSMIWLKYWWYICSIFPINSEAFTSEFPRYYMLISFVDSISMLVIGCWQATKIEYVRHYSTMHEAFLQNAFFCKSWRNISLYNMIVARGSWTTDWLCHKKSP